jgi:heterodisulfide reductase subunit A-like polyferredoxin
MGNPMTMNSDLLVLMVGMCASEGTATLSKCVGIDGLYRFAQSRSPHTEDNLTAQPGLYLAGSCKRPMCIEDTIQDARAAALEIM